MKNENPADISVNDILNLIQSANQKLEHQAYIPSLNKEAALKPLNANHIKNVTKSALDGKFSQNKFALITYEILKNIVDPSISMAHINTLDKAVLMLEIRNKNTKKDLEIPTESLTSNKTSAIKVDLDKHLKKIKKEKFVFDDIELDVDSYKLVLNFPSVEEEYQFENYLYNTRLKDVDESNMELIKSIVASMFINTIAQYIKGIHIDDKFIDLRSKKVGDRINIVENLLKTTKIIEEIDKNFGKQLNKVLLVSHQVEDEEYVGKIELSPIIFLS